VGDVTGDGVMDLISGSGLFTDALTNQGVLRVYRGTRSSR